MAALDDMRGTLKLLIENKGIVVEDEPFTLSSGKVSNFYYDIKQAMLTPSGLRMAGELGFKVARRFQAKSVGGLESGSIPFATAISLTSEGTPDPVGSFFVRKNERRHGRRKWIEGAIESPALIVEDVVTTGKSALDAAIKVEEAGIKVAAVLALVDREEGAADLFRERRIALVSIFSHTEDFKRFIDAKIESFGAGRQ